MGLNELAALFHYEPVGATFTFLLLTLAVLSAIVAAVVAAHTLKDNVHDRSRSHGRHGRCRRRMQAL